jgi:dynein heavy chain
VFFCDAIDTFLKPSNAFYNEFNVLLLKPQRVLTSLSARGVLQGLLMCTPEQFNDPVKLSRLWLHESERVYADRLVSHADLATYNKNVQAVANKFFRINDLPDYYKREQAKPLIFSHFAGGLGDRVYNEVTSFEGLSKILEEALAEYNETNAMMDLVLFEDALKHVCRISRIISNPGGHALLVGVGGSGKQSLSKLAAHTCGMAPYMIVISGSYNTNSLKEDLQKMFKRAGLKGEGIMWLFTDSQITDERFMVFINDLLASGEVPDLFPIEDKDEIINQVRGEVKAAGLVDTREVCWDFFINKCRQNLHMVRASIPLHPLSCSRLSRPVSRLFFLYPLFSLTLSHASPLCLLQVFTCSPVGEQFRVRAQRFLAMINSTVIDWFQPWPERALMGVSKKFLDEVDLDTVEIKQLVVEFMPLSFSQVGECSKQYLAQEKRFNYTTPKTFLELIKLYKNLLAGSRTNIETGIDRLQNGLDKLEKTQKDVDVLVEQAKVKAIEVEEKVVAADAFAEKVGEEKEKAGVENDAAAIEAAKCGEIAAAVAIKQVTPTPLSVCSSLPALSLCHRRRSLLCSRTAFQFLIMVGACLSWLSRTASVTWRRRSLSSRRRWRRWTRSTRRTWARRRASRSRRRAWTT